MTKKLAIIQTLGINLLILFLLLVGIEGCVRLLYPEISPIGTDASLIVDDMYGSTRGFQPNSSGYSNGALFQIDSQGFIAYASSSTATDKPSWLFLGDSVTMGIGVHSDSTFAGRLSTHIDTLRILNPSLIGYSARDYLEVLKSQLEQSPPLEHVTLFWCLNDTYSSTTSGNVPGTRVRYISGDLLLFIRQHVRTYAWLKGVLFDRARSYYLYDRAFYAEGATSLQEAFAYLAEIDALCKKYTIVFDVVVLPYEYQLRNRDFLPQRVVLEELKSLGIPVYDPSHFLLDQGKSSKDFYLWGDGIHFSEEGHRLLADFLRSNLFSH